jgi:hypothetical protein
MFISHGKETSAFFGVEVGVRFSKKIPRTRSRESQLRSSLIGYENGNGRIYDFIRPYPFPLISKKSVIRLNR